MAKHIVYPTLLSNLTVTTRISTTNTSARLITVLETALGTSIDLSKLKGAFITVENNDCRISIGVAADNDSTPVGHVLYSGDSFWLTSKGMVENAYIISKTNDAASDLQVTLLS